MRPLRDVRWRRTSGGRGRCNGIRRSHWTSPGSGRQANHRRTATTSNTRSLVRGTAELLAHDRPVGFTSGHNLEAVPNEYRRDTRKQISRVPGNIGVDRIRLQRTSSTRRAASVAASRSAEVTPCCRWERRTKKQGTDHTGCSSTGPRNRASASHARSARGQPSTSRPPSHDRMRGAPESAEQLPAHTGLACSPHAAGCGIPDRAASTCTSSRSRRQRVRTDPPTPATSRRSRAERQTHHPRPEDSSAPPPSTDVTRADATAGNATRGTRPNRTSLKQRSGVPCRCPEKVASSNA